MARVCSFPDCGKPHYGHSLCRAHLWQQNHGVELRPVRRVTRNRGCAVKGCTNKHKAHGYCATHLHQHNRGAVLTLPAPHKPRRVMPKTAKPTSILPKGWDKTTEPVKPRMAAFKGQAEIPLVTPTDPAVLARAARTVELMARVLAMPVDELADELGLVAA